MPILTMPATPAFKHARFRLLANTQTFVSPLDRSVQSLEMPGARWAAELELPAMKRAQAAPWQAFLAQLRGGAGRFYAGDPDARNPRGAATGAPQVNGAGQTGGQLATKGWSASVAGILKAGDYIAIDAGVGRLLHIVTTDAASDGAGNALLAIEPPIRVSPLNNANLIVSNATCIMRLIDDTMTAWEADAQGVYAIRFAAIETFF